VKFGSSEVLAKFFTVKTFYLSVAKRLCDLLGLREFFPLRPNKAAAAARARDIYLHLVSHGWDPTLEKYKPKRFKRQATSEKQSPCTVGTFFEEVLRSARNRRTVESYATAFRTIVSDSFGLSVDKKKYDYYYGGHCKRQTSRTAD
jgi:hypothetical protein